MTKSKLAILPLLALLLGGCDVPATAVGQDNVSLFYVSVICNLGFLSVETCQVAQGHYPPSPDAPFSFSDAAPFAIWIAEANSATAMSEIRLDPDTSSSPTITGLPVFPGKHAGGITAWLDDPTQKQYGLYLWHDNTVELLSATAAPVTSMTLPVSGTIWDFTISKDGRTGVATVKGDTRVFFFDLVAQKYTASANLGIGASPRASVTLATGITAANVTYVSDAVNGTVSIADPLLGSGAPVLNTTSAELGKPAALPNGTELWIPDVTQNSILVWNFVAAKLTSFTLPNLFDPREIVFSRDGKTAYILFSPPASFGAGSLAIVDTSTHTLISNVKLGTTPSGLALSPQGTYAFVANSGDGNIATVDSSNNVTTYKVGTTPVGVVATH